MGEFLRQIPLSWAAAALPLGFGFIMLGYFIGHGGKFYSGDICTLLGILLCVVAISAIVYGHFYGWLRKKLPQLGDY